MTRRTLSLQPSEEESGHRALNSLPTHNVQLYQVLRAGHPYPPCRRRPRWPAISASLLSLCVSSVFRGGHPAFEQRPLGANCKLCQCRSRPVCQHRARAECNEPGAAVAPGTRIQRGKGGLAVHRTAAFRLLGYIGVGLLVFQSSVFRQWVADRQIRRM